MEPYIKINKEDFKNLVKILSNWKGFLTANGRIDLIKDAFDSKEFRKVSREVVPEINYDGRPKSVAWITLDTLLTQESRVIKQYLLTFKRKLNPEYRDERELREELDTILNKYSITD